ncbi:sialidase family protein [Lysobacter solisilvae (ex Woo and Kim 2020)]|uniref:Exo-alpha-sialidase n=1 Tax=Agrilutibacter terrestris TaxID=2865112 RepID=A0A7H0FTS3_9GAMM|nr:sialidase family protein [Lysobacter terrestris]QNP39439.1 exo-alpha-sialidase [Lysobacter terrestris]
MKTRPAALLLATLLAACNHQAPPTASADTANAQDSAATAFAPKPWALPVSATAAQPDLVATPDGRLLLSWVEPQAHGHALKFAYYANGAWSAAQEIARGEDWFVNWADTPHVAVTRDGALWAHWLQKSANASYAYDVVLSRSADGGRTWSPPLRVNDDGKPAEHGFVSLWPAADDRLGVAWLDGREAGGESEGHDGHDGGGGAMTLRAAAFDAKLQRFDDTRVDAMTCDCCQTDVAMTARGPLLVFRDRTDAEIRDIYATRLQGGAWRTPQAVHADQWQMPACPVNGPAVAARGDDVLVGWYTAANNLPTLKLARSRDAGDRFGAPVVLDRGEAVQGRIDVAFDGDTAWAAWLREDRSGQSLQLVRYSADLSRELQRIEVAKLQGRGRGTGFPQLALHDGVAHLVWTDVVDGRPQLQGAVIAR